MIPVLPLEFHCDAGTLIGLKFGKFFFAKNYPRVLKHGETYFDKKVENFLT